jgi:PadR family transcriptional regulator, regulatory protein PadR
MTGSRHIHRQFRVRETKASLTRILWLGALEWNTNCQSGAPRRPRRISPCLPSDLVQGTLDMLLLKILALEPMNGFAVSQRLKQVSGDILQVSDGSLYPALHKLEQEGWITAEWKTSEYGRRAKYYSLTRLGRRQLEKEADNWGRLSSAISRVIKIKEA